MGNNKRSAKEGMIERKNGESEYTMAYDTPIYSGYPGAPKTLGELEDRNPEWFDQLIKRWPSTPELLRNLVKEKQKEVREKTGEKLTQEQIAEEIGVSKQTFSEWLQDKYEGKYRENNLSLLADYFHVDVGYLKGEQIERIKDGSISPERMKSRNLEIYLETLGFSFTHGYGMDPTDPLCDDPYNDEYYLSLKEEIVLVDEIDENGNTKKVRTKQAVDAYTYPYGKPLMITFPSGRKILVRENTFDEYCGEFEEWIEFVLGKLLEHASNDDISMGTIPPDICKEGE